MRRPVHFEIHARDPELAATFYRSVFGWHVERWSTQPYWTVATGEGPGIDGGLLPRQGPLPEDDTPVSSWVVTVEVEDVHETLRRAEAAGGRAVSGVSPIPGVGSLAYLRDPDGNLVGVLQPEPPAT